MKSVTFRAAGIVVAAALVLAGCSDSNSSSPSTDASTAPSASAPADGSSSETSAADLAQLDKVTVTGEAGAQPTIEFEGPLTFSDLAVKIYSPGTGDEIQAGQKITVNVYQVTADTGTESYNSYTGEPEPLTLTEGQLNEKLLNAFVGQKVGVRVLLGAPGTAADAASGTEAQPGSVAAVEVLSVESLLDDIAPDAPGTPQVKFDDAGVPAITLPKEFKAPTVIQRAILTEGDGEVVTSSNTIKAHYLGVKASDGSTFDSSWSHGEEPIEFSLQQVVSGWTMDFPG